MVVDDGALPEPLDWAVARVGFSAFLFVKRRCSTFEDGLGDVIAEAWRASGKYGAALPVPFLVAI